MSPNELDLVQGPFDWDQVQHYVSTNQIKRIHRSPSVQVEYDNWIKNTLSKYGTIENYLLSTKLHFPPSSTGECPSVVILPNDFPYYTQQGILHILIWSKSPLSRSCTQMILEEQYGKGWEWVYWVNPPEIQSVRKLPHVHVFLRRLL
ncbi:hypothetical protein CLU79DRAFT_892147 [Phycomyces nitens]|nr:hypothetical protein CLU79DRAFT_892147 [Phycomyces nitens]